VPRFLLQLAAAAVLALLVAVPGWIWLHLDDPPVALADLHVPPGATPATVTPTDPVPAEVGNASWQALRDMAARMDGVDGKGRALDVALGHEEDAELQRELSSRADAVATLLQRVLREPLVVPVLLLPEDGELLRRLGLARAALVVRARTSIETGRPERDLTDLAAVVALGSALQGARGADLFVSMTGLGLASGGLRSFEVVLPQVSLDAKQSRRITDVLVELNVDPDAWRAMWGVEYGLAARRLDAASGAEHDGATFMDAYTFKPNASRALFSHVYATFQDNAMRHCGELERPPHRQPPDASRKALELLGPNGTGRLLTWVVTPGLAPFEHRRCGFDTRLGMIRAQIALRAFLGQQRRLPDRLEELVPEWLAEVPLDHFDGALLHFDPARRLLYSVGSEAVDSYGVANADEPLREPVAHLRF
jgi:hypothetical protein